MNPAAMYVDAVGLLAPGLLGWERAQCVLRGEEAYDMRAMPTVQPGLLPPNERRRAPPAVRIAFAAAEEAVRIASLPASEMATVFASSDADMSILHRICGALATPTRIVSPTDFHNSVHNAAAGYWSIGASSRLASSTVAAHDYSFAMGLLEASSMVLQDELNTLLVAYDVPPPAPLFEHRPIAAPMAIAMVFTPVRSERSLARIELGDTSSDISPIDPRFDSLSNAVPPARALPLLALLARRESGTIVLECPVGRRLQATITATAR